MAAAATTGQIIPNIVDHHRRIRLANLTKLIDVELGYLKESFQEAKRRIDPMIAQINQARDKFDELLQRGGEKMMEVEMERELQDLKQTTSKWKSKIPTNLIAPEYQPSADPNVIFQPRNPPTTSNSPVVVDDDALGEWDNSLYLDPNFRDNFHHEFNIVQGLHRSPENFESRASRIIWSITNCSNDSVVLDDDRVKNNRYARNSVIFLCFLAFPQGAFIKSSLLCSYATGVSIAFNSPESVVSTACELVSAGLIKSVYKKHSSRTIEGFSMDPLVHHTLKDRLSRELQLECLVNSSSVNGDDIIYSGSADTSTWPSELRFLHLGKWQRSPTHHNIEMPDPNLYFKYAGDMHRLAYISFRGVSAMKELPNFVTHLEILSILDLKACHHLEVVPSDIGNLWCCLVHLDMSECYFLDHMPASLSRLTRLSVLKGFFVGETNNEEESCTLQDLSSMVCLVKLNIYTSLKTFPNEDHLKVLQGFEDLRNLTICWGGYPIRDENRELSGPGKSPAIHLKRLLTRGPDHPVVGVNKKFSFSLKKLDLRGAPETGTRDWLKSSNFGKLEKLYIRGGQLTDLKHANEAQKDKQLLAVKVKGWSVKILRLRHLSRLQLHWSELQNSFPNVVSVEKVDCPNLTSFPCDYSGLWTKDTTQPPVDGSERHGVSRYQRGPVECEDTAVEILEQTAE